MGEFWLIKDPIEIKDRMKAFQTFLEQEWCWEKPVAWQVKEYKPRRSLSQNDLFHVWVRDMTRHFKKRGGFTGTEDDLKLMLKYKFLGTEDVEVGNTTIPAQVRGTSTLDRGEMLYFMQQVEAWCIDLGSSSQSLRIRSTANWGVGMSLLQFCKTERQKAIISRVENGVSQRVIAKELGLARSTVVSHLDTVKNYAAKQGYSPDHDYTHPVPDGFTVKGVSTLYTDGKPVAQWVKSQSDKEHAHRSH